MIYDLSRELDRLQFKERCELMVRKAARVELTEKHGARTLKQNAYLHVLIDYFALQIGEKSQYVKQELFKRRVNHTVFALERDDRFFGRVLVLRSTADLTTGEMTECIDRWRNWAAQEAGIYLPTPEEHHIIGAMQREIEQGRRWIE